jgi:hypothetical protein
MDSLSLAKGLRKWQEENPKTDMALGFVPGVGQVLGAAEAAAAARDPDASAVEKGMGALSVLPMGKVADKLRKIVITSKLARQFPALAAKAKLADALAAQKKGSKEIEKATGGDFWRDPTTGKVMHEIDDSGAEIDWQMADLASKADTDLGSVLTHPELMQIDPTMSDIKLKVDDAYLQSKGWNGAYSPQAPGYEPKITTKSVPKLINWRDMANWRNTLFHETQHAVDDAAGNLDIPSKGRAYWESPDEIRARLAASRIRMTPEGRKKYPFRQHILDEKERLRTTRDADLGHASEEELQKAFTDRGLNLHDYIK